MLTAYYQLTVDRDGHERVTETFPSAYAAWRYLIANYPTLNDFATGSAFAFAKAHYVGETELSTQYSGFLSVKVECVKSGVR